MSEVGGVAWRRWAPLRSYPQQVVEERSPRGRSRTPAVHPRWRTPRGSTCFPGRRRRKLQDLCGLSPSNASRKGHTRSLKLWSEWESLTNGSYRIANFVSVSLQDWNSMVRVEHGILIENFSRWTTVRTNSSEETARLELRARDDWSWEDEQSGVASPGAARPLAGKWVERAADRRCSEAGPSQNFPSIMPFTLDLMLENWICAAWSIIVDGRNLKDAFPCTCKGYFVVVVSYVSNTDSLQVLELQGANNSYIIHSEISIYIIP